MTMMMHDGPIINIITRTSNRPNDFKMNREWVLKQTYPHYRHIVCCDDEATYAYTNDSGCDALVYVDREKLIREDETKYRDPKTGWYSPHNLYMNECHKHVKDGWIIYIDDDDRFYHRESLEEMAKAIERVDEDTLVYWRIKIGRRDLPQIVDAKHPPKLGNISSQCFAFHSKYKDAFRWDGWKCGDHRFVSKLHGLIKKYVFLEKTLIYTPKANYGKRNDNNLKE